jgi:hypothetical protein
MTTTKTDAIAERERLRAELVTERTTVDENRAAQAKDAALVRERQKVMQRLEMDSIKGRKVTGKQKQEAMGELALAEADQSRHARTVEIAGLAMQETQANLNALYESREGFEAFVLEAIGQSELVREKGEELRRALAEYARAWGAAEALWRPLLNPLIRRIKEADAAQGRMRDHSAVVREASVPPYPIQVVAEALTRPPVPAAVQRLTKT